MRVVSLLPSATEIVSALGHRTDLVGRSADCDYPPEVQELPVVMRARADDTGASSASIDRRVRAARAEQQSLYSLDFDILRALAPDLLITQDLCGVCSVTDAEVQEACATLGIRPQIVSLTPRTLPEVWDSVDRVARALGDPESGTRLRRRLRARSKATADLGIRVAVVEWLDPPFLAGLWTPEIVRAGGGTPVGPLPGQPGFRTTWAEIGALSPDLVVLSPCSFSVDRTRAELEAASVAGDITAVAPRRGVFLADEAYFSRPGPRLAHGIDLIRNLVRGSGGSAPMPVARWPAPASEVAG